MRRLKRKRKSPKPAKLAGRTSEWTVKVGQAHYEVSDGALAIIRKQKVKPEEQR